MARFSQNLKKCSRGLTSWSKAAFGHNMLKIIALKSEILKLQELAFTDDTFSRIWELQEELEDVLDRKEMYLHQRSRVNWLRYGDKNLGFFHATVIQRRQRNQLVKLKLELGIWFESDEEINAHLLSYLQDLFKASGPRDFTEALSVVDTKVTANMNASFIQPITDAEIKLAAFQLGPLKALAQTGLWGFFIRSIGMLLVRRCVWLSRVFFRGVWALKSGIIPTLC